MPSANPTTALGKRGDERWLHLVAGMPSGESWMGCVFFLCQLLSILGSILEPWGFILGDFGILFGLRGPLWTSFGELWVPGGQKSSFWGFAPPPPLPPGAPIWDSF